MRNPIHSTILKSNDDARTLELTGTPAFFIINSEGEVCQNCLEHNRLKSLKKYLMRPIRRTSDQTTAHIIK